MRKAKAQLASCECELVQIKSSRARKHCMELQRHLGLQSFASIFPQLARRSINTHHRIHMKAHPPPGIHVRAHPPPLDLQQSSSNSKLENEAGFGVTNETLDNSADGNAKFDTTVISSNSLVQQQTQSSNKSGGSNLNKAPNGPHSESSV